MSTMPSQTNHGLGRSVGLFVLLAVFTATLFVLSRTGLVGPTRTVVLLGVATVQAVTTAFLLLGVGELRRWLQALLLLVLFFLVGLLAGPTITTLTAPI